MIAMAWSHSKAPQGHINFSLLLRRTFGFRNTGRKNATNFKSVKIYLDRVILKNEENVLPAASVTIALDSKGPLLREKAGNSRAKQKNIVIPNIFSQYVGQLLGGRLLTVGTPVSISIFGVSHRFLVQDIKHKQSTIVGATAEPGAFTVGRVARVLPSTRIIIRQGNTAESSRSNDSITAGDKQSTSSFRQIGGLDKEIQMVRQMIEVPLHQPQLFVDLGIKPPKGVLLYGPPGTGKTMIAKAVASDINASFFSINGPELVNKYVGKSESGLRDVFNRALEEQPSIIFIDEIDAMCPRRDGRNGDDGTFNEVEELDKRMVSTLLTLMDGASTASNAKIMVIAATNRPQAIDQALRRPGRFDKELEIGVPNKEGRNDILRCMLREIPHQLDDETLQSIASVTHGFVGADLKALCQEATMHAIYEHVDNMGESVECDVSLTKANFDHALNKVKPSALRELSINVPSVKWTDIGGQDKAKQRLLEAVEWPLRHAGCFR